MILKSCFTTIIHHNYPRCNADPSSRPCTVGISRPRGHTPERTSCYRRRNPWNIRSHSCQDNDSRTGARRNPRYILDKRQVFYLSLNIEYIKRKMPFRRFYTFPNTVDYWWIVSNILTSQFYFNLLRMKQE